MKRYDISVNGKIFTLISLPYGREISPSDRRRSDAVILLSVSERYELSVRAYDFQGERYTDVWAILAAVSYFLKRVRGLPLSEIDIELFGERKRLELSSTLDNQQLENFRNCKYLFTKPVIFDDRTEHRLTTVRVGKLYRIIHVSGDGLFDRAVLDRLLVVDGMPDAEYSLALLEAEKPRVILPEGVSVRPSILAAAALGVGGGDEGELSLVCEDREYTVSVEKGGVTVPVPVSLVGIYDIQE